MLRRPNLGSLTLIREHAQPAAAAERPELSLEQLPGTWLGQAITVFPDGQPGQAMVTQPTLRLVAPNTLGDMTHAAPWPA